MPSEVMLAAVTSPLPPPKNVGSLSLDVVGFLAAAKHLLDGKGVTINRVVGGAVGTIGMCCLVYIHTCNVLRRAILIVAAINVAVDECGLASWLILLRCPRGANVDLNPTEDLRFDCRNSRSRFASQATSKNVAINEIAA